MVMLKAVLFNLFLPTLGLLPFNLGILNEMNINEYLGDDLFFEILDPKELAYTYKIRLTKGFGTSFNSTSSFKNISLVTTEPSEACSKIKNFSEVKSNVALIKRGECSFLDKTVSAEFAGAVAVIIYDNNTEDDEIYIEMIGDNSFREVNIPAGFLLGRNGYIIVKTLKKLNRRSAIINLPVNLTTKAIKDLNQPPWIAW